MKRAIVMFAKAPVAGDVKTRLGASIGYDEAARLHAAFIHDLVDTIDSMGVQGVLAYSGDPEHPGFEHAKRTGFEFVEQPDGDLGDRLSSIVEQLFDRGFERLVVIGSDSPTLSVELHLMPAFAALDEADVVFGPSFDGGYYALGLNGPHALFHDIPWSTRHVLEASWHKAQEASLLSTMLGFWYDVDVIEDLQFLRFHLQDVVSKRNTVTCPATQRVLEALGEPLSFS